MAVDVGPLDQRIVAAKSSVHVQVVEPKRVALGEAEALLLAANAQLQEKQAALAEVQAKVEGLKQALAAAQEEQAQLRAQASSTTTRLQRAAKLTSGLQEEGIRWGFTATQTKVCTPLCIVLQRQSL